MTGCNTSALMNVVGGVGCNCDVPKKPLGVRYEVRLFRELKLHTFFVSIPGTTIQPNEICLVDSKKSGAFSGHIPNVACSTQKAAQSFLDL